MGFFGIDQQVLMRWIQLRKAINQRAAVIAQTGVIMKIAFGIKTNIHKSSFDKMNAAFVPVQLSLQNYRFRAFGHLKQKTLTRSRKKQVT
jgi:hypothetical protein